MFNLIPHQLNFKFKAGTSRGFYTTHHVFYIRMEKNGVIGTGEVAPLKDLSIDAVDNLNDIILNAFHKLSNDLNINTIKQINDLLDSLALDKYPAIRFGLETAFLDFINGGGKVIFNNDFTKGNTKIPINGLVWMGDREFMFKQIKEKIEQGFTCIKMKIGAIDFKQECELLKFIRTQFSKDDIELRVDANGAFSPDEAMKKLNFLSEFQIHSIEQPIKPKQWSVMRELCEKSPIPIALDEELIGIDDVSDKEKLLEAINPHYIILKPTLIGGLQKSKEWIDVAEQKGIGWWFTSALESNVGLNAIAQFSAEFNNTMPQGLGTGSLYENNIDSPLRVENGFIFRDKSKKWDLSLLD